MPYYPPHSFRHLTARIATNNCKTAEELKAVSENIGHKNVATTMMSYGAIPGEEINQIIRRMNFDPKQKADKKLLREQLNKLLEMLDEE